MEQRQETDVAWWDAGEALTWIAFRQFVPAGNWCALARYQPVRDWSVLPGGSRAGLEVPDGEAGLPHGYLDTEWLATAPALLNALEARAARKAWEPQGEIPIYHPRHYQSAACRLVRDTGLDAAALAIELRADMARSSEAEAALLKAEVILSTAVGAGWVRAVGLPVGSLADEPLPGPLEEIPALHFCGPYALTIDREGSTLPSGLALEDYCGKWWASVKIHTEDLRSRFPAPPGERANTDISTSNIRAERQLQKSLTKLMSARPDSPVSKSILKEKAKTAGHLFTQDAFERAFKNAAVTAGAEEWLKGGRRRALRQNEINAIVVDPPEIKPPN